MKKKIGAILLILLFTPTVTRANQCMPPFSAITDLTLRGDYERAVDRLIDLEFGCSNIDVQVAAVLLQSRLYELSEKSSTSIRLLERYLQRSSGLSGRLGLLIRDEQIRMYLLDGNFGPAMALLDGSPRSESVMTLSNDFVGLQDAGPWPVFYASASIVPGLGQALMGEYLSAISSIFMIALPAVFAIQARRSGENAFELASWTLSGFFYLGNISSTYRFASLKRRNQFEEKWEKRVYSGFPTFSQVHVGGVGFSQELTKRLYPRSH